ncbi:PAS domain-containing sensor histidine kinase [Pseudodonghicola flavimaris]|uniref:histidine kinase n=1 Tax=Pseudodonghicola flavimaris TaxID=3050036 RepID=A0ABT7EV00_9RHOB|nr:PAS domain-containing sensor histidine kinase [Pseudodonghicola flavimaris]MDK3016180.1 PAS domain-containing sensor histidine kinase [Pseudodonghicola flavimaris]
MNATAAQPDLASLFPGQGRLAFGMGDDEGFLIEALGQHAVISVADAHGRILYVNRKFVEISGYCREELLGESFRAMRSDEHSPGFFRDMWETIVAGRTWNGEIKNYRKTGEPFWVRTTIVPYVGADGQAEKYLSVSTDITETKLNEAIHQQRLSFDLIREEIHLLWPDTLTVFYSNRSARTRLKALGQSMAGLNLAELLENMREDELAARLAPLRAGVRKWVTFEASQHRADGRSNPVEVTIQMIAPDGERSRLLAHIRNISQRKQAEIAKQQFVANVSHELRTPLTTIKGAFELIRSGLCSATRERSGQLAAMGLKNTERLEHLIEDLLDMERIASGRLVAKLGKVDICELIAQQLEEMAGYKPEKAIRFHCQGLESPVRVKGDEESLVKVLHNLLTNAVKFSHPGGVVDVSVERSGAHVGIVIRDQGVGIPETAKPYLFEPFTQAEFSDQAPSEGAGLGLSIARSIVEEHGGAIEIDSTEGQGTEVGFYLISYPGERLD